jgi:hypothetical protein
MNKNYFKKLSEELNTWVKNNKNWREDRRLIVEQTGFRQLHVADRGLNHNESKLLSFGTKIIEAQSIHLAYEPKYNFLTLYVKSTIHSNDAGTYLELRKDGKTFSVTLHDRDEKLPWRIKDIPGFEDVSPNLFQCYAQDDFKEALTKAGYKILVFFRFTHVIAAPSFAHTHASSTEKNGFKKTQRGFELKGRSFGTYNSVPYFIEVKKAKSLGTIPLQALGIEQKGYYSHDQRCSILKSEALEAKRFFKRKGLL